jgi:NADH:ubiquinone oxidoreductase subunit 6 (subunit J)
MAILAEAYINWSALWKIIVAALIGGAGVVVVFGFLLLAVKRAQGAKSEGGKIANYALGGLCGLLCVGAVVVGIVAMADKPASKAKSAAKSKSAAVHTAPASEQRLVASVG